MHEERPQEVLHAFALMLQGRGLGEPWRTGSSRAIFFPLALLSVGMHPASTDAFTPATLTLTISVHSRI